jgi:hypothetical protein
MCASASLRRLLVLLVAVLSGAIMATGAPALPAPEEPPGLWFPDLGTPLRLTETHGNALCRVAWNALRSGGVNGRLAAKGEARAVFLSWSDGTETAQVVFGLGNGPVDALRAALDSIKPQDFPRDRLRWLKVDVVQDALTIPYLKREKDSIGEPKETAVPGFYARECSLPAPSLLGVAFSHTSHFAFLPEELLSRNMLDSKNRLLTDSYAAKLGAQKRMEEMVRWTRISALHAPQKVSFFETQAWFYDGTACLPLYRGHRLYENPSRDELAGILVKGAQRLAGIVDDRGRLVPPVPEWIGGVDGKVRPFDAALAILALARASQYVDDKEPTLQAADHLAAGMLRQLHPLGKDSKAACFIEEDYDQEQASWYTVRLETNGLCTLALSTLAQQRPETKTRYDIPLAALAHYLLQERRPDGSFVAERLWPSRNVQREVDDTASALAVCALLSLYDKTQMPVFRQVALAGFDAVLPNVEKKVPEELARDEWFLRAANRCFTYTREERYAKQAERFVQAAADDQTRSPLFADFYGCVPSLPSATAAASRTGLIAVASRLMRDATQDTATVSRHMAGIMLLAEVRPSLVAQLQGSMGPPEVMYLPKPPEYLGYFRDHVRAYGLDLQSQYAQILSLCELVETMDHLHVDELRFKKVAASRVIDTQLAERDKQAGTFPDVLRYFDGTLQRHRIILPSEGQGQAGAPEEKDRVLVVPVPLWRTTTPAAPGAGGQPAIRPVAPGE